MVWPFLYLVGERLSQAELTAARIDGDLVEVGDAFMPADAVETAQLRAGSLRALVPPRLAATRATAAWVHGAIAEAPLRHCVQRATPSRIHHVLDRRLQYSDRPLPADHVMTIAGVAVTIPERTLTDLVRDHQGGDARAGALAEAMIAWEPGLAQRTALWLAAAPPMHNKRPALRRLRERAQEEVTRYTS